MVSKDLDEINALCLFGNPIAPLKKKNHSTVCFSFLSLPKSQLLSCMFQTRDDERYVRNLAV